MKCHNILMKYLLILMMCTHTRHFGAPLLDISVHLYWIFRYMFARYFGAPLLDFFGPPLLHIFGAPLGFELRFNSILIRFQFVMNVFIQIHFICGQCVLRTAMEEAVLRGKKNDSSFCLENPESDFKRILCWSLCHHHRQEETQRPDSPHRCAWEQPPPRRRQRQERPLLRRNPQNAF